MELEAIEIKEALEKGVDGEAQTSNELGDENDALARSRFRDRVGRMGCRPDEWGVAPDFVLRLEVPEHLELDDVAGGDGVLEPHPLLLAAFSSAVTATVVRLPFPAIKDSGRWKGGMKGLCLGSVRWSLGMARAESRKA